MYRLQQIRRILEDLREQIRYLQVCVRDSLDLVSRLRTTPASPDAHGPSSSNSDPAAVSTVERPSQSASSSSGSSTASSMDLLQFSSNGRMMLGSRGYSPIQCRRFAHYLDGRLRRIGLQQHREYPRLHRPSFREARGPIRYVPKITFVVVYFTFPFSIDRRFSFRSNGSMSPVNPVEQIDPQPSTSRDYSMEIDDDTEEEPSLERGLGQTGWRRSRFARLSRRSPLLNRSSSSNCLLHVRQSSLAIQRRKQPSILNRTIHGRSLQSHLRSVVSHLPSTSSVPVAGPSSSSEVPPSTVRADSQSLRPLMERLESHFRLQRQTMGILAQLNEAAGGSGNAADAPVGSGDSSIGPGPSGTGTSSFSDSSASARPWAHNVLHNVRSWRTRREPLERTHSLEFRAGSGGGSPGRFQVPRRVDSALHFGVSSRYRIFRPPDDDDSSDTDTDLAAENTAAHRWRQSSPIRSPRGVEQRMRFVFNILKY